MILPAKKAILPTRKIFKNFQLHLLLLPSVLLLLVFNYAPMAGLVMAFEDFKASKGVFRSPFVGLKYFHILVTTPEVFQVIINTLIFTISQLILLLIVPLIFALLLNEVRKTAFKRFTQTITYLPHFLSWVIMAGILKDMLRPDGGLVNQIITALFGCKPIFFLGQGDWFRFTIITSGVWKEFGFSSIVIIAAIAGINPSMYEAAYVDGANRWQQVRYITLPSLVPIMVVLCVLNLSYVFSANFDQIFNLYNALVYDKGDVIDTFVYRTGLIDLNFSFSTAVGMFRSVASLFLVVVGYRLAYRYANYRIF